MSDSTKDIERLRAAVEQKLGRQVRTPKDFEILRDAIFQERHEMVSVSTLKRIWGYIQTDSLPRTSSLTPLAQYAGYADWNHFVEDRPAEEDDETVSSQLNLRKSKVHRFSFAAAMVVIVALATWAAVVKGVFRNTPETSEAETMTARPSLSDQRVLHKGDDYFRTIDEYLLLFGIEGGDSAYIRPLPGHDQVFIWGPEYGHPVWHNEGDKKQLMPTITEYWIPLPGTNRAYTPEYIKKYNAGLYEKRMRDDELRIVFMKNIVNGFYAFLGIYRFDREHSSTERSVWKRVADDCDLGLLGQIELLRTEE